MIGRPNRVFGPAYRVVIREESHDRFAIVFTNKESGSWIKIGTRPTHPLAYAEAERLIAADPNCLSFSF